MYKLVCAVTISMYGRKPLTISQHPIVQLLLP